MNYIVGGTYELNQYRAQHGEGEAQKASQRFVEYADTMNQQEPQRLNQLLSNIAKLLSGDVESYMTYARSLPDIPGYLHGVLMSKKIDAAFGRDALVGSASDPVKFLLLFVEAARRPGLELSVSDSALQRLTELTR